jgi:hypothetical protein
VTGNRADALARPDFFVGEWVMEARFPGDQPTPSSAAGDGPRVRSRFEWALDRQFLLQRTEIPIPEAPDSLTIVSVDPQTGAYTQRAYVALGAISGAGVSVQLALAGRAVAWTGSATEDASQSGIPFRTRSARRRRGCSVR